MEISEILNGEYGIGEKVNMLMEKSVEIPSWEGELCKAYYPKHHPVNNKAIYPDKVTDEGVVPVTRVALDFQRLAVKRLAELCYGVPVKRVYKLDDDDVRGHELADIMDSIFENNRIDSVNLERGKMLFASCEVMTLWYTQAQKNKFYGVDSDFKLRNVSFSPFKGDELYPYFDEYGDLTALSVRYLRKENGVKVQYFDTYTADRHIKFRMETDWAVVADEAIEIGKIPAIYMYRPTPAWEDTTPIVEEMEWSLSRNGNYLRENSRPLFVVFADEEIPFGNEPSENKSFKSVLKYPKGSSAQYVTWQQSTDALRFHTSELKELFFTQLQLPDWSFENMKAVPQSGESMKQMFIDAVLKVREESGRLIEFHDREINVVKAFMKKMLPNDAEAIDALRVNTIITPCTLDESSDDTEERSGELKDGKSVEKDDTPKLQEGR